MLNIDMDKTLTENNWLRGEWLKLLLLFAVGLLGMLGGRGDTAAEDMIRLHIFANSDSVHDQQVKLVVRDAVLEYTEDLLAGVDGREEIESRIEDNLPQIAEVAQAVAGCYGCAAQTAYGDFAFGERRYGDVVMPAGKYRALKIELGEGRGHNWFCVLYPEMGFRDSLGSLETEQADGENISGEADGKIRVELSSFFARCFRDWLDK